MTNNTLKTDAPRVNKLAPDSGAEGAPWRTMTACDALAFLVAEDVARRTREGRGEAHELGLGGPANRRRLVAWRRENQLCPKCGRGLPADEPEFKNCPLCRESFRNQQSRHNRNMTAAQRLARNERARKSYHKIVHGTPPPKVVAPAVAEVVAPVVAVVAPVVAVVAPKVVAVVAQKQTAVGPKRDRAAYFRAYRANRANRAKS